MFFRRQTKMANSYSDLTQSEIQALASKGVDMSRAYKLGSGKNRTAYRAHVENESYWAYPAAILVPHKILGPCRPQ